MIDDRTALPKYLQLSERLVREMAAGRLQVGDRLPPERQMAEQLGVAVGTLRKALAKLREQGVLETRQGSGNYITRNSSDTSIYALFRLERVDGGGLPRARVLSVDRLQKPPGLPGLEGASEAHRIRRLRSLDDQIVAAEEIWLDSKWAEHLDPANLSESLYLSFREKLGLLIVGTEDRVGVSQMPDWGEDTGCKPGATCGHFSRLGRTADGQCPESSQTWFNSERACYVARR